MGRLITAGTVVRPSPSARKASRTAATAAAGEIAARMSASSMMGITFTSRMDHEAHEDHEEASTVARRHRSRRPRDGTFTAGGAGASVKSSPGLMNRSRSSLYCLS